MPVTALSPRRRRPLGPHSRRLQRGAIANLDGRSTEGRYARALERELTAHLGGSLSVPQKLLLDRVIGIRLRLDALDRKMNKGAWTIYDGRVYGALLNAERLTLRELNLSRPEPAPARRPGYSPPANGRQSARDRYFAIIRGPMPKSVEASAGETLDPAEAYRAMRENKPLPRQAPAPSSEGS